MTLALAREKLSYNATQLSTLSQQIRQGDLTPVLKIYEEDIKTPMKSVISGTLLRSMFIQIQKAKVSIMHFCKVVTHSIDLRWTLTKH
jgi:nuclear-control-of-ATPase protein 2